MTTGKLLATAGILLALASLSFIPAAAQSHAVTDLGTLSYSAAALRQQAELTASDGQQADELGLSSSISGNTAAVGAPRHTVDINSSQGAVYVYTKPESGWESMTQVAELTASDGASNDQLGGSVAISDSTIVATGKGKAYVFVEPDAGWENMSQIAKLSASDGAFFGSVALDGDNVVASGAGAVYLFIKPTDGWKNMTETSKLFSSNGVSFGAVAIDGGTVAAGSSGAGGGRGAVYIFVKPSGGWPRIMSQTAILTASDRVRDDQLGISVGLVGNTAVAGASGRDRSQGAVYVFVASSNQWGNMTETARLAIPQNKASARLGASLTIGGGGNLVVAGAPDAVLGGTFGMGAACMYVKPSSGWTTTASFDALCAVQNGDGFGYSVALSGQTIVAGSDFQPVGSQRPGAAFIFQQ